jgi:hypothetical protein
LRHAKRVAAHREGFGDSGDEPKAIGPQPEDLPAGPNEAAAESWLGQGRNSQLAGAGGVMQIARARLFDDLDGFASAFVSPLRFAVGTVCAADGVITVAS